MSGPSKPEVITITVMGDGGVGKTAITVQFVQSEFIETYDPTIEDSYVKQIKIDNLLYKLQILDTAGQDDYEALRDQWVRLGSGFVLVYSITSRSTFERIDLTHERICRVKNNPKPYVVLVGNKCDRSMDREVVKAEGMEKARNLNCGFQETSARIPNGNVDAIFEDLVRMIRDDKPGYPEPTKENKVIRTCQKCLVM